MMNEHYIEDTSLSVAWARAVRVASMPGRSEIAPLTVSVTGFDDQRIVEETPAIRTALDALLQRRTDQTIETVANTIFPDSLWNPAAGREQLFKRYERIKGRLKEASPKNRHGIYFERMIAGGRKDEPNQLRDAISMFLSRDGVRRSALQIAIFDPSRDHSTSAQLGFPCLQHVTFAPYRGALNVNAFYATQYLVERGYGNYLGLCRLGRFVAHELGLPLGRLTCLVGIAQCDGSKGDLAKIFKVLDKTVAARAK
jgi:hypothetical protein